MRGMHPITLVSATVLALLARSAPALEWLATVPLRATDLAPEGNTAWLALDEGGVLGLDLTVPDSPVPGSPFAPTGYGSCGRLALEGSIRWQVDDSSLRSFRVDDPASPTLLGRWDGPASLNGLSVSGDLLLVCAGSQGLYILDGTDPGQPGLLCHIPTSARVEHAGLVDHLLVLAEGTAGLRLFDLENPAQPQPLGAYDSPGAAMALEVHGSLLYLADDLAGLCILDIQQPGAPVERSRVDTPGWASDLALAGNTAFVADRFGGLQVVDVTDPDQPVLGQPYPVPGSLHTVDLLGDLLLLGGPATDLQVLHHGQATALDPRPEGRPRTLSLESVTPNPFNPRARVAFRLDRRTRVDLTLHDLQGRRVQTLLAGTLEAGRHAGVIQGEALASGLYLVKLEGAGTVEVRRVLLIK